MLFKMNIFVLAQNIRFSALKIVCLILLQMPMVKCSKINNQSLLNVNNNLSISYLDGILTLMKSF